MANQHVNKVAVNGKTVLDLSADTVYPGMLAKGITAHDKSGAPIVGTLEVPATEERMVELSMPSGNQVILPTSGKVMSKVTVQKPDTLLPENIKKDVVIGGVTGALEAGDTSETWVIKSSANGELVTTQIAFTSNGQKFTSIGANSDSGFTVLRYDNNEVAGYDPGFGGGYEFDNEAYRKLTFDTPPTGALLTWLQSNATKQTSGVSVQNTKALTITTNGTVSVTPDVPYDALKKVDVTVNVASSGGGGETTSLNVSMVEDAVGAQLFCLWQTSDGWMGTTNFDTTENFTIPNVIVGGYVIFTRNPAGSSYFSTSDTIGVENISVGAMDAKWDIPEAALVIKVTAPSPRFFLNLSN